VLVSVPPESDAPVTGMEKLWKAPAASVPAVQVTIWPVFEQPEGMAPRLNEALTGSVIVAPVTVMKPLLVILSETVPGRPIE